MYLSALLFIRPLVGGQPDPAQSAPLFGISRCFSNTGLGFAIQQKCLGCTPALIGEGNNSDLLFIPANSDSDQCFEFHIPADLAAGVVVLHLATLYGLFGQTAGLEKTGRPEPLIEAYFGGGKGVFAHVVICQWVVGSAECYRHYLVEVNNAGKVTGGALALMAVRLQQRQQVFNTVLLSRCKYAVSIVN
ncbi:MAG: hypothetical protein ACI9WS_000050 [Paraglaciecola psychrophila]|jgi:hypothetical protein